MQKDIATFLNRMSLQRTIMIGSTGRYKTPLHDFVLSFNDPRMNKQFTEARHWENAYENKQVITYEFDSFRREELLFLFHATDRAAFNFPSSHINLLGFGKGEWQKRYHMPLRWIFQCAMVYWIK